jgi:phosphatidylglycerol:prolipoprotein diacylglycerol transferase
MVIEHHLSTIGTIPVFDICYLTSILITALIVWLSGLKKGYPGQPWCIILLFGLLFFFIGERLALYTEAQWTRLFSELRVTPSIRMTLLGGFSGLILGVLPAKKGLGFKGSVFDTFAIALPMAIAISRVGCLAGGCCHGSVTTLPWGIQYGQGFETYSEHLLKGLIIPGDAASLPVHPVQLYELSGCLLLAFLIWISRKQWKSGGNLFLTFIFGYAFIRFVTEFFREPVSDNPLLYGLGHIQWILLAVLLVLPAIMYKKERMSSALAIPAMQNETSVRRKGLLAVAFILIFLFFRELLTLPETIFILAVFVTLLISLLIEIVKEIFLSLYRWIVPLLLICSLILMSQSDRENSAVSEKSGFTTIGFSGMIGKFTEEMVYVRDTYTGGCDNPEWINYSENLGKTNRNFYQGALEVYYTKWKGKYKKIKVGGQLFWSGESGGMKSTYPSGTSIGITPWFTYDWRWFGFTTGVHMGGMKLPIGQSGKNFQGDTISKQFRTGYIWPGLDIRVGPYDIAFIKMGIEPMFPALSPFSTGGTFSLGTGLGKTDGRYAEIGVFANDIIFAHLSHPVSKTISIEVLYGDNFRSSLDNERVFRVGIGYRLSPKR